MSRQHLKELQQRAQKLLQVSSDEDDLNAYTATNKSRKTPNRFAADDFLFDDDSQHDLSDANVTNVQILKKCITLTNQNNHLRSLTEKQQQEIQELKMQLQRRERLEVQLQKNLSHRAQDPKQKNKEMVSFAAQLAQLQKQISEMKVQKILLKKQYDEFQKQKDDFRIEKEQFRRTSEWKIRQSKKEIEMINDYTIKTKKIEQPQRQKNKDGQYQQRIRRLQGIAREQRSKVTKLCQFINAEIPHLKDKMVELTTKLDVKVSKYLLRDISY